jgi:hypothetical protein
LERVFESISQKWSEYLKKEKVYFTSQPMKGGTHHPQPMKMNFLPLNFLKHDKSPLKQF